MKWKQLPYWMKGGIIGGIILLIIGVVLFILSYNCFIAKGQFCKNISDTIERGECYYANTQVCNLYSNPLYYISEFPFADLMKEANLYGSPNLKNAIITDVFNVLDLIIVGFILGAVIGWIYGRLRKK
jgi:hypothetical protein